MLFCFCGVNASTSSSGEQVKWSFCVVLLLAAVAFMFLCCFAGVIASYRHDTQSRLFHKKYFFTISKIVVDSIFLSASTGHL